MPAFVFLTGLANLFGIGGSSLMARSLVEMETYVFVGLLLLRDAAKCEDRAAIAERYVLDSVPEFRKRFMRVTSGDVTLIDNNRDIIDY